LSFPEILKESQKGTNKRPLPVDKSQLREINHFEPSRLYDVMTSLHFAATVNFVHPINYF